MGVVRSPHRAPAGHRRLPHRRGGPTHAPGPQLVAGAPRRPWPRLRPGRSGPGRLGALPAYLLFAWLTVGLVVDRPRRPPAARSGLVVPTGACAGSRCSPRPRSPTWDGAGAARRRGGRWAAVYLLLAAAARRGLGFGDVRLAPARGAARAGSGWGSSRSGSFAGFLLVGLGRAGAARCCGRVGLRRSIAFGPAMCLGA